MSDVKNLSGQVFLDSCFETEIILRKFGNSDFSAQCFNWGKFAIIKKTKKSSKESKNG